MLVATAPFGKAILERRDGEDLSIATYFQYFNP
jgi:hypothetical protein